MAVKVLGPMDVGGQSLGPRERTILAALIVRRGTIVAPGELADAWWRDAPPATWAQQIRNSIARIRTRMGREAVETVGTDYRLGLDPDSIDAVRFERLASEARAHALRGDDDRAVDAYRRALALWRGAPFSDVADWEPAVVEALRLGEIRASLQEELLDARLRLGDHRAVIPDAERLVRENPLREDGWAILALANYRADRQAEALATVRAARERLADELGIEPGARLTALETGMLRRDTSLDAPIAVDAPSSECPYPGLRSFFPEEAELFFGREADIDAVTERLRPGAAVVVAGPSGTGKSSLALAGVIPRLIATGRTVHVLHPSGDLEGELEVAGARANVVVIDQAEEIGTLSPAALDAACRRASELLKDGRVLLFTVRSDALDRLRALPHIGDALGRGVYLLGPLTTEGCRAAVEEPAHRSGLKLEPGLTELALRDLGDRAGTLPHLSHALRQTWMRREGATLTVAGYEAAGGIAGAIAQSAEEVYRRLDDDGQATCRSVLLRLVVRDDDGSSTRRRVAAETLVDDPARRRVIEQLASARLLFVDGDTVTIAHEAVATAWPRLDDWLTEDRERARVLRMVESAADAWDADGRSDDDLLRGARLHLAMAWREASTHDLTAREAGFLDASAAHETASIAELEDRAATERSRNRTLRAALGGAAALLVAVIVAGAFAAIRGAEAQAAGERARLSSEDAHVEAIVASSIALEESDRSLAALLAVEAFRRWPGDARVRAALLGAMISADGLVRQEEWEADRMVLAAIPGTRDVLVVVDDAAGTRVQRLGMDDGVVQRTFDVDAGPAGEADRSIAVSADGALAAVQTPEWDEERKGCCANRFAFFDTSTGQTLPGSQLLPARTTSTMVFSDDGSRILFGNSVTQDVQAIDVRTGAVAASAMGALADHVGAPGVTDSIAVPAPGLVAVGGPTGIQVFDQDTLSLVRRIATVTGVSDFALAADGIGGLVGSGPSGVVRADAAGAIVWSRSTPPGRPCWKLAVDAGAGTVYCSMLGSVTELDLASGAPRDRAFATFADAPSLAVPLGGDWLLVHSSIDPRAYLWALDGSGPAAQLVVRDRLLVGGLSADGTVAITAPSEGGAASLWDLATDAAVGDPADALGWLPGGVYERWTEEEGSTFIAPDGSTSRFSDEILLLGGEDVFPVAARPGPDAFAVSESGSLLIPFDPLSGERTGPVISVPGATDGIALNGISETIDGTRVALTYYDFAAGSTLTAVFDTASGDQVATGLAGTEGNAITQSGDLIAATDTSVTRFDIDTLEPLQSFPKAFSSAHTVELSDDDATMLVVGWDNRATLYGMPEGVKLASFDAPSPELGQGAHLTPDGGHLVASGPEGIILWDLDPAHHAEAACALAGREFTDIEWQTYFGDDPQRATCDGG